MEMMLYGGSTAFNGAPSMYNNYCAQPTFAQNNPYYFALYISLSKIIINSLKKTASF